MATIVTHADDYGLCHTFSDRIFECISDGALESVSIIVNTNIRVSDIRRLNEIDRPVAKRLHLNLVEGKPLSLDSSSVLVNSKTGEFRYGFLGLLIRYYTAPVILKQQIRDELRKETEAQLCRYKDLVGCDQVALDSHMHFHMLPFMLSIITDLRSDFQIYSLRMSREKLYFSVADWQIYTSSNTVKVLVLNILARLNKSRLAAFDTNDYLIGILNTGRATLSSLRKALGRYRTGETIEVAFHPGGVQNSSEVRWTGKRMFHKFYSSAWRDREYDLLRSDQFGTWLNNVRHDQK